MLRKAMMHFDANDIFIMGLPPDDTLLGHLLLMQSRTTTMPCCPVLRRDVEQYGPAHRDDSQQGITDCHPLALQAHASDVMETA